MVRMDVKKLWREMDANMEAADELANISHTIAMTADREPKKLLVVGTSFPQRFDQIRYQLLKSLSGYVSDVSVEGDVALPFPSHELLEWCVLGKTTERTPRYRHGGCDLYVGIESSERLGQRGYKMARQAGIPSLILKEYDARPICDFVRRNVLMQNRN